MNMAMHTSMPITSRKESAQTALGLVQLERQVERSQLFSHSALGESALRLGEVQVFLHGLIDTLLAKGIVTEAEIMDAISKVRSELVQRNELNGARIMVRSDGSEAERSAPVKVDCASRLHICHAACCKLDFALSIPEVESGTVKWDLGRPYFIRHDSHGSCVHLDSESGGCRIYKDRPGVCKGYSCATDSRIWKDFEKMELNQEWINANLSQAAEPHVVVALMHGPDQLTEPGSSEKRDRMEDEP
jgi:Fe-S-cluster containining protein